MAVIFYASSLPDLTEIPLGVSDHTGHFTGYAILGALVLRAFAGARWDGVTLQTSIAALAFSSLYGASDEFHQRFVHGRTPAVDDWVADTLGAAAAIAIVYAAALIVRRARSRSV